MSMEGFEGEESEVKVRISWQLRDGRYLSGRDSDFVERVLEDVRIFNDKGIHDSVLVFPPFKNFHRFLVHNLVEENFGELSTFSVGQSTDRRTVVCFKDRRVERCLDHDKDTCRSMGIEQRTTECHEVDITPSHPGRKKAKVLPDVALYQPPALRRTREASSKGPPSERKPSKQRRPDIAVYVPRALRGLEQARPPATAETKRVQGEVDREEQQGCVVLPPQRCEEQQGCVVLPPQRCEEEQGCVVLPPQRCEEQQGCVVLPPQRCEEQQGCVVLPPQRCEEQQGCVVLPPQRCEEQQGCVVLPPQRCEEQQGCVVLPPQRCEEQQGCVVLPPQRSEEEQGCVVLPPQRCEEQQGCVVLPPQRSEEEQGLVVLAPQHCEKEQGCVELPPQCNEEESAVGAVQGCGGGSPSAVGHWEELLVAEGGSVGLVDEVVAAVGRVSVVEKPRADYGQYRTDDAPLSLSELTHVVELFGFPAEFKTHDLVSILSTFGSGFEIKWVDDTHALAVFASSFVASDVLHLHHPMLKTRTMEEASAASRAKAKKIGESLRVPYRPRPETCAALAQRLITGALGVHHRQSKAEREEERRLLREAREKRRSAAREREAAWEGTIGGS